MRGSQAVVLHHKTLRALERDIPRIEGLQRSFERWQQGVDASKLVSLDESGVTTAMTRTRARAPRGEPVTDQVPRNRRCVTTLLGAMTTTSATTMMAIEAGTSTDVFESFLRDVLLPKLEPGMTVVMDNLGAHRAKRIAALLHEHGNPIEMFWGWLKARLRSWRARTVELLDIAVGQAMQDLPPEIAASWAVHAGYTRECR